MQANHSNIINIHLKDDDKIVLVYVRYRLEQGSSRKTNLNKL